MVSGGRRLAAWLSLACYLFAVTAASSFHDHGAGGCAQQGLSRRNAPFAHSGHEIDGHANAAPAGRGVAIARGSGHSEACAEDTCPVCHFLLLKLLPKRPVESLHAEALRETAVAARPLTAVRAPLLLQRSRAPPQIA